MYIKENDFKYFDGLYKNLDEEKRKTFLKLLLKAGGQRSGEEEIRKIQVVGDEIFDVQAVAPEEFITRTMIKKAYKTAKEVK